MFKVPTDAETIFYTLEWAIRIGALAVVPLRREPAATRSWLLLIFFLPVPGLLLYLAIGRPRFPAWRAARFERLLPYFDRAGAQLRAADPPALPENSQSIAALAKRLGRFPESHGNAVDLIQDYDALIDRLVQDIDAAKRYVLVLVYIFADDATGQKVIAALGRAVARGVSCQVMIDAFGSKRWRRGVIAGLSTEGVTVKEALPRRLFSRRTRRDMRNHRKLFVIDGLVGFAGSQNIVSKNFKPGIVNHELVARVTGPAVAAMEAVIRGDWYLETEEEPASPTPAPSTGSAIVQLLPSGANYPLEGFETLLVWQIHEARERVTIVTPYFIPDEDVLSAMRTAVARNVTIDLVLSKVVDQRLVNLAQSSYYDDLLSAGVHIHLYRDFLLHAKNVSIDDRLAVVGSSNVDLRSFQLNDEVSLLLYDTPTVACVQQVQKGYLANSDSLDLETWRRRPALRKLGENIARMVGPLF